ncbi:hypothetical protein PR048_005157 [Dryococelus australis]|uniref:YqaJ viral recombinase domain-containing protein n=1 Tax=Dryococelus australis TaxID=614101 RepID=A0ABQ9I7F2_9NEOP|nr:hypothetical protein PR048_005157 [Dryococelus australis]
MHSSSLTQSQRTDSRNNGETTEKFILDTFCESDDMVRLSPETVTANPEEDYSARILLEEQVTEHEEINGIESIFHLFCNMCGFKGKLISDDPCKENRCIDITPGCVNAMLMTGQGCSQLQEMTSAMDMICISKETFNRHQKKLSCLIYDVVWERMQAAGKEEAELAIAAGEIDSNGVPFTTVVADEAWTKKEENNLVPYLQSVDIWDDILAAKNLVAFHAESLIHNVNTNTFEGFNSIICKYVGGKRVNFALRGSYQMRNELSVISHNTCGKSHRFLHKRMAGSSPDEFIKLHEDPKEISAAKCHAWKQINVKPKCRRLAFSRPDKHRGNAQAEIQIPDIDDISFDKKKKELLLKLALRCAATKYGIANEPFAISQLQKQLEKKIEPAGLFVDPDLPWLAATPDGLVGNDALVEVKCPVIARNLTHQEAVKEKKLTYCILKDGHPYLKENHSYMYQVPG